MSDYSDIMNVQLPAVGLVYASAECSSEDLATERLLRRVNQRLTTYLPMSIYEKTSRKLYN